MKLPELVGKKVLVSYNKLGIFTTVKGILQRQGDRDEEHYYMVEEGNKTTMESMIVVFVPVNVVSISINQRQKVYIIDLEPLNGPRTIEDDHIVGYSQIWYESKIVCCEDRLRKQELYE